MITAIDQNTALILIDLQNGIVGYKTAHPIDTVLANAARLADAFREAGLPVVIVNVNPALANWAKVRADSPSPPPPSDPAQLAAFTAISPVIKIHPGDIRVTKHTWNAFFETPLHDELKKRSITQIVLGGVSTSIGVEGTARAANELGYNIAFAADAMTDTNPAAHEHTAQRIFPRIGEQGPAADIIAKLKP